MLALILAAGKGSRLLPATLETPKPLLQIDGITTLLDLQLKFCQQLEITKIKLVTGYLDSQVRDYLQKRNFYDTNIEIVTNKEYSSGSLHSFKLGIENVDSPFLVLNADHVFETEFTGFIKKYLKSKESIVFCDSYRTLGLGEAKVFAKNNRVIQISKSLTNHNKGYVGISLFTKSIVLSLQSSSKLLDKNNSFDYQISYEEVINDICLKYKPIRCVDIGHTLWTNINTPEDLSRMRKDTYWK